MRRLLLVLFCALVVSGCYAKATAYQGKLTFAYQSGLDVDNFVKPIAPGAKLEVLAFENGTENELEITKATSSKPGVLAVDSFDKQRIVLKGVVPGVAEIEITARDLKGVTIVDRMFFHVATPATHKIEHACTESAEAAYVRGDKIDIFHSLATSDRRPVIGVGYVPLTIQPAGALVLDQQPQGTPLYRFVPPKAAGNITVRSNVDSSTLTFRVIDRGELKNAEIFFDERVVEGRSAYIVAQVHFGDVALCSQNALTKARSLTPDICTVTAKLDDEPGETNHEQLAMLKGLKFGVCKFELTLPELNGGRGVVLEGSSKVGRLQFPGEGGGAAVPARPARPSCRCRGGRGSHWSRYAMWYLLANGAILGGILVWASSPARAHRRVMDTFEKRALEQANAGVRTKRTWLFAVSVLFAIVGFTPLLSAILLALHGQTWAWLAVPAYYGPFFGLLYTWNRRWLEERGAVRADETGLSLGDRLVMKRAAIRHGYVMERAGRTWVRLVGGIFSLVDVEVDDAEAGEALLLAMRLDAARSVAQFPLMYGSFRGSFVRALLSILPLGVAPALALLAGGTLPVFITAIFGAAAVSVAYSFNQIMRMSVGADGIRIRRLLQRARYIPFSAIASATLDGRDITITLADGEVLSMHHAAGSGRKAKLSLVDHALEAPKLIERINRQIAAHRAGGAGDAPVFARAGRETEAWLRDVVSAADGNASYRTPAVPPDELWRIVEDTLAAPTARAGAAVALRQALDERGRVRLHTIADACAAPRLRVALETVAAESEDDAELFEALEPLLDDEEPRARRAAR